MKLILLFLSIILLFASSCSDIHQNSAVDLKATNDSLTVSNEVIKQKNDSLYKILEGKLQDGRTAEVAILWVPKALYLKYQSAKIYTYLDSLISNPTGVINTDSLYRKLRFYKDQILRIDPEIYNEIKQNAQLVTNDIDSTGKIDNRELHFTNKTSDQVLLIINRAKNNIESIENQTL